MYDVFGGKYINRTELNWIAQDGMFSIVVA